MLEGREGFCEMPCYGHCTQELAAVMDKCMRPIQVETNRTVNIPVGSKKIERGLSVVRRGSRRREGDI